MAQPDVMPFKVDQLAESRSFIKGFRGSWFRCKIKAIAMRKQGYECALEFYDYTDEKVSRIRLYQIPQRSSKNKPILMLRPQFPRICKESELPDVNTISEVSVVRNGVWKVGDEVDWFKEGCYWSGEVTKILTKEKVRIKLPSPPVGEGQTYDVHCKDLRPSLDWSIEHGWSVPISKGGKTCARLIKPVDKGSQISEIDVTHAPAKDATSIAGSSSDSSFSSDTSSSLPLNDDKPEEVTKKHLGTAKTSYSGSVSTSQIRDEENNSCVPTKRMKISASVPLNSTKSDTLEATLLDLEELVNKVKWLKGMLSCGTPSSNARGRSWEFLNCRASFEHK